MNFFSLLINLKKTNGTFYKIMFTIIGNGRLAFDFKKYNNLVDINYPLGLEIDTNGILYATQGQSVWVINPR